MDRTFTPGDLTADPLAKVVGVNNGTVSITHLKVSHGGVILFLHYKE